MERLSGLDHAFLQLETPTNHMQVMAVALLDPAAVEDGFDLARVRTLVESRLHLIPPFRRRLATVPFDLYHPLWIEDPDFDLDFHVRRVAVPAPGGPRELAEVVGDIAGRPLDRSRPLWQLWVAEGLEHGHVALVAKVHHAAIDGASGVEVLTHLVDLEPNPEPASEPAAMWHPDRVPTEIERLVDAWLALARHPVKLLRATRNISRSVLRVVRRVRDQPVPAGVPFTAPRLPWNATLTAHREVAFASVPLDDVRRVKDCLGATVNDVVLAMVAGVLRRYLEQRDELPDRPLVAVVPTSVRVETQQGAMGNRVSALFTRLPTDVEDPLGRIRAVQASMSGAKLVHEDIGGKTLSEWADLAAPAMLAGGARLYGQLRLAERLRPIMNLIVSNVPGPTFPLYLAGAKLVGIYPLGPVFDGAGLNVTVISYLDTIDVGFMACREVVPELWTLADAVPEALAELVKCASGAVGKEVEDGASRAVGKEGSLG